MGCTLIVTSCWCVEASAADAWQLLTRAEDWPRWWSFAAAVRVVPIGPARPHRRPMSWPALFGRPLRLRVSVLSSQAPERVEWHWQGDLEGRATWLLNPDGAASVVITSRCELHLAAGRRSLAGFLASWLLERRVFALTRGLAADMGRKLGCRISPLREWQGSVHHR